MQIVECKVKQFQVNRFYYTFVGAAWAWTDNLSWSEQQWREYAERPELRTWLASVEGSPAGYYELEQAPDGSTEIMHFGLAEAFIGSGLGAELLSEAITSAWAWPGTERIRVHTCSEDHPHALQNYQARGFEIYREEQSD